LKKSCGDGRRTKASERSREQPGGETVRNTWSRRSAWRQARRPPPGEAELAERRRLGVVVAQPVHRVAAQVAKLELYQEHIATWLDQEHLLLTRIQELLARQGGDVTNATLRATCGRPGNGSSPG